MLRTRKNFVASLGLALAVFALAGAYFPAIGQLLFPAASPRVPSAVGAVFFSVIVSFAAFIALVAGFYSIKVRDTPLLSGSVAVVSLAALWVSLRPAFLAAAVFVALAYGGAFVLYRRQ